MYHIDNHYPLLPLHKRVLFGKLIKDVFFLHKNGIGFRIIKATNYRFDAPRTIQDEFSQEFARQIVELIDKLMLGIL